MPRIVLAIVLSGLVVMPGARAGQSLSVRPARPGDDVAHKSLTEWWQVLAFDPASRTWVRLQFVAKPWPDLELWFRKGNDTARGIGSTAMKVAPHKGPGVTLVGSSPIDPSNRPRATLSYTGKAYVVDVRFPTVRAHLKIVPKRAGFTVGPWPLGREQVSVHPPSFVRGTRMWSVPVATGSATGSVEADGHRVVLRGWRAYHDHTWGSFKLSSTTWFHSDFALRSPRIGEAWILNGLERGYDKGGYRFKPDDRRWRGVLVHVSRSGASACSARIVRSGWARYPNHADGWDYWLPSRVTARCSGGRAFSARPESVPWGLTGFMQALLGSSPVRGRSGWIEHATPPFPNV